MRHQATVRSLFPEPAAAGPATAEAYNEVGDKLPALRRRRPRQPLCVRQPPRLWRPLHLGADRRQARGVEVAWPRVHPCARRGLRPPAPWLRRIVARARELGFRRIFAHGFDLAEGQVERARALSEDIAGAPGVRIVFEVGDLTQGPGGGGRLHRPRPVPLRRAEPYPDRRPARRPRRVRRVTRGWFVASVRAAGSTPSIFIDSVEKRPHLPPGQRRGPLRHRAERRSARGDRLPPVRGAGVAPAGRRSLPDRGHARLDIFHGRFAPDPRWNPQSICADEIEPALLSLEEAYARRPAFIDRAAHLLLVGRPH